MKQHLFSRAFLAFFALSFISGCSSSSGPSSPVVSTGRIEGTVNVYEMDCTQAKSFAGVNVNILGTNITAVSDSTGNYILDSVSAGYYSILFSKPGFADYILPSVTFVGGGIEHGVIAGISRIPNWKTTISPPTIYPLPQYKEFQFAFDTSTAILVDSSGRSVTNGIEKLIYFFGRKPIINYLDTGSFIIETGWYYPSISDTLVHDGDTIYLVSYPYPCGGYGRYNYYVGDTLKTAVGTLGPPSNTLKVVLP